MQPSEEERRVRAPKRRLPQSRLPLAGLRAGRGAEEEEGAGLPQPDR